MTDLYIKKIKSLMSLADTIAKDDEIYLRVNKKRFNIGDFRSGTAKEIRKGWEFVNGKIRIELWDEDYITKDDKIGEFTLKDEAKYQEDKKVITGEGSSYEIDYCIVP